MGAVFLAVSLVATRVRAGAPEETAGPKAPNVVPDPALVEARDVFWSGKHGDLNHSLRLFQGGRLLEGADQYRAIDRPDLAKEYLERRARGNAEDVGGAVLVVGGLVTFFVGAAVMEKCSPSFGCENHGATGVVAAGLIGMVLGGVLALAVPDPRPVSDEELQRLVDAHNGAVKAAKKPFAEEIMAAPVLVPGAGAGFTLSATF